MPRPTKALMACLTVAVALLASVTASSANRISQTSRTYRATLTPLRITDDELSTVSCNVTLEGSFHSSTFAKVAGALVGYVNRASLGSPCTGGTATLLRESLPWHMEYEGYRGTLPNITEIDYDLAGFGISVDPEGILGQCLARSEAVIPFVIGFLVGANVGLWTVAGVTTYWSNRRAVRCGTDEVTITGEGSATVAGSTTVITVRLI